MAAIILWPRDIAKRLWMDETQGSLHTLESHYHFQQKRISRESRELESEATNQVECLAHHRVSLPFITYNLVRGMWEAPPPPLLLGSATMCARIVSPLLTATSAWLSFPSLRHVYVSLLESVMVRNLERWVFSASRKRVFKCGKLVKYKENIQRCWITTAD